MPLAPRTFRPHGSTGQKNGKSPAAAQRSKHYRTQGWQRTKERIKARDAMTCQACKKLITRKGEGHVDHIVAVVDGGTDEPENLQLLCSGCHSRKTMKGQTGK